MEYAHTDSTPSGITKTHNWSMRRFLVYKINLT